MIENYLHKLKQYNSWIESWAQEW